MRVLLCTLNAKYIHVNLAIRLLYELNKEKEGLEWKEFTIKENPDEIAGHCSQFDLIAFSCYIWNITPTLEVAKKIKALNPNTKILLGGPEVSYDWDNVISQPAIDYIITGEGEIPFKQLMDSYPDVSLVSNLVRKENGKAIHFQKAETFDLINYKDILPYCNDVPETLFNRVLYIETSRGCPYKCEFCLASLDNKVRYLPNENIKANLLYLMQHGRVVKFLDRTFNIKKDFTLDIFKFILENHRPQNVFQFEITADILHPDIIKFIHEHVPPGLFRFEIGIQTVNQKANLEVSRKQNFDKTKGIINSLSHKVEMHLDLIVGLPFDYWEDIKYSFEEVFKLFAPELQLGFLKFLKGTPMRDKAQHGFVFDPNPPYQLIESKYLSKDELNRVLALEHALEIYWNKKRAINTLKYVTSTYGSFDFLLGLGEYFGTQRDYHKFSLMDIYEILYQFANDNYPDDSILKELITVDYYLQSKLKPKTFGVPELAKHEKNAMAEALKLNHHKFRHSILPLSFNFKQFEETNKINSQPFNLIIQYTGTTQPEIVYTALTPINA
ncbi:MAG: cobalamin-binding protein [Bacteroidetes bacterium]|nr:cobalamin-binding protein [Bacteroidota bacterium]